MAGACEAVLLMRLHLHVPAGLQTHDVDAPTLLPMAVAGSLSWMDCVLSCLEYISGVLFYCVR